MRKAILVIMFAWLGLTLNAHNLWPQVEGTYKSVATDGEAGGCGITVVITKNNGQYFYSLKLNGTSRKGKVKLSKGDNAKETYITFAGIKWAEYEGDVSKLDDDAERPSLKRPVGLDGLLSGKEIMIQNSGNAMNSYTKLADCDQKYIRLVKQK